MNTLEHATPLQQVNLIRNGSFTDKTGNASTEYWSTNTAGVPVRIPGGRHQLSLGSREFISQPLDIAHTGNFKVHYAFQAAATHPTVGTYIRVKVANSLGAEEIDITVNNRVLYRREHTGTRTFSLQGGDLYLTLANEVLNPDRLIALTDIELWIEPL